MDNTVEVQELGKVMITPKGEYSSSKSYEILDAVSYNGSSYVSKINDNTSVPTSNDWQLLAQKGDVYDVTEEDLQAIAKQITDNANSAFNQNVETKTKEFNTNAKSTTETFDANAKKKLDEYNANDTKKLKAYNDNADSKIEEYNTNANSKILEYDKHSEELRKMAISTDNELKRVKNEILDTGSASDSFVHVEDSCMAKIKELEIDGVLSQETTKGVNLIKLSDGEFSSNGIIAKVNKGIITINGTSTAQTYLVITNFIDRPKLSFEGYYTLSLNTIMDSIDVSVYGDNNGSQLIINSAQNTKTVVINGTYESVRMQLNIPTNKEYNNYILKPQLESGKNATSFEPYTGGQPSPNPDYPQEIRTITDSLKVTSCGKNLFNFDNILENMAWDKNGLVRNSLTIAVNKHQDIHSSAITFSVDFNQNSGTQGRLLVYDKNKTLISNNIIVTFPFTKVFESNAKYYTYYFLKNQIPINSKIQLEFSNIASEYEPYVESQIQVKLPKNEFIGKFDDTYKDIVRAEYFPEEGQYHLMLDKMIGKYTFTGNENWSIYTQSNGIPIFRCTLPASGVVVKSNYFVSQTTWPTLLEENRIFNHVGNYQNIEIACSKFDTLTNFKNILTTNVVQMYYGLKTPYTLDLGPIDMPLSYKGITNIFTDSDLLPKITAKYYRTFEKTILNMQINEKSLKQEIIDLNVSLTDITKRLEVLESANVNTVEESEASNDLQN